MADFAANLERFADRQIVDMTGLKGHYDFALDFTPEDYRAMLIRAAVFCRRVTSLHRPCARSMAAPMERSAMPFSSSVSRLEARKAPLDVLVIDDALKTPTAN